MQGMRAPWEASVGSGGQPPGHGGTALQANTPCCLQLVSLRGKVALPL